jgi:hypothetical protein
MRHDWIFDVLEDLRVYASLNGLPGTVVQVEEALRIARAEAAPGAGHQPSSAVDALPVGKRTN